MCIRDSGQAADYVVSGHWGKTALKQAAHCIDARTAASSEAGGFRDVPARSTWQLSSDAAYAVSYTHLDVYKRQDQRESLRPLHKSRSKRVVRRGIDAARRTYSPNAGPVSYTHLDVYKRQVLWNSDPFGFVIKLTGGDDDDVFGPAQTGRLGQPQQ